MMTKDLNVCLYPMTIEWDNVQENLKSLDEKLKSVKKDTDLIILPETFTTGFPSGKSRDDIMAMVTDSRDLVIETLCEQAHKYNLAICCSIVYAEDGNLYNRGLFIEPNMEITYADKRHLFSMAGEDKIFTRGNKRLKIRYRGWNISMAICYDLRFPVWCRNIGNEYDLLIFTANWPEVRISAWEKLLPARAIENESYVCAVNCKGTDPNNFSFNGSSTILDFKGNNIGKEDDSLIYATLSLTALENFRCKFPAYTDADSFCIK